MITVTHFGRSVFVKVAGINYGRTTRWQVARLLLWARANHVATRRVYKPTQPPTKGIEI